MSFVGHHRCPDTAVVGAAAALVLVLAGAQARQGWTAAGLSWRSVAVANGDSSGVAISADGRFVAFGSEASNLVAGDGNLTRDVFVRDLTAGTTERASVSSREAEGNRASSVLAISADGRLVVFASQSSNLVGGDTKECGSRSARQNCRDVFVRDRVAGTTERVSVSGSGAQADSDSGEAAAISADGRFVAFVSEASNLVAGDTNRHPDVFLRDRVARTTERVSVGNNGVQAAGAATAASISADGRYVAFESDAANLVAGDTNRAGDVFVHDRAAATTERLSVGNSGQASGGWGHSISADGRTVAFSSSKLDEAVEEGVFVRDLVAGRTERISAATGSSTDYAESVSRDGRFVVYATPVLETLWLRDRTAGTTERLNVSSSGDRGDGLISSAAISGDGRFVAFDSTADNLVAGDTTNAWDVFLRDRKTKTTRLISVGLRLAPRAGRLLLSPWPARAGRPLNATMPVAAVWLMPDGSPGANVQCNAKLAGRKLPPCVRGYGAGNVRCVWKIPNNSRGKRLTGSLIATTAYGTASRPFRGIVR